MMNTLIETATGRNNLFPRTKEYFTIVLPFCFVSLISGRKLQHILVQTREKMIGLKQDTKLYQVYRMIALQFYMSHFPLIY
jgi:hypothetical protein